MLIIYCPYLIRSTIPTPCYTAIQIGQADCRPADNNLQTGDLEHAKETPYMLTHASELSVTRPGFLAK